MTDAEENTAEQIHQDSSAQNSANPEPVATDHQPGNADGGLKQDPTQNNGNQDFLASAIAANKKPDMASSIQESHIEVIMDVPITLSLEIGRKRITIRDLLQLNPGSVVKLERMAGEPMDIMVNGCLIAKGEVVTVGEKFGVRIAEVVSSEERIKSLR